MRSTQVAPRARLLLVDDDPVVLNTLCEGLRRAGYDVVAAPDPCAGLREYVRQTPDLVVLDIGFPGVSGTQLAQSMLEYVYRPILILSGHSGAEHVREAVRSGVMGYLVKPVTADQLIPSIETARARFADLRALVKRRWRQAGSEALSISAVLNQLAFGLLVVDGQLNIVVQNEAARRLVDARTVLGNHCGRLTALVASSPPLSAVVAHALKRGATARTRVLRLTAPRGVTHHLMVSPLTEPGATDTDQEYATLLVVDPRRPTPAPAPILNALYGLTTKESRLAEALLNGETLERFCRTRCVSANTARTQLKSIYQKTGTHRQAELVRTLATLFGPLELNGPT